MQYFDKGFRVFFKDLSRNNTTEWFNENRKRYESDVKRPFNNFVEHIIERASKLDKDIRIRPADAIMRINKDIRFSKDKTPYNTYVAAIVSPAGKKDKSVPGLYLQLSHDKITLFGGAYVLEPPQLKKVREKIASEPKKFAQLYTDKNFSKHFKTIQGEKSKRLDASLQALVAKEPLAANKQFFFSTELKPDLLTSDKLADVVMEHFQAAHPLNTYLAQAIR
jgi:uncharacterized protein (TIGR02453 family)